MATTSGRAGSTRRRGRRRRGYAARPVARMLAVEILRTCQRFCQLAGQRAKKLYRSLAGTEIEGATWKTDLVAFLALELPVALMILKGLMDCE